VDRPRERQNRANPEGGGVLGKQSKSETQAEKLKSNPHALQAPLAKESQGGLPAL